MKATEQYFPVALFYYALQVGSVAFESVDEITKCDHSNKSRTFLCFFLYFSFHLQYFL